VTRLERQAHHSVAVETLARARRQLGPALELVDDLSGLAHRHTGSGSHTLNEAVSKWTARSSWRDNSARAYGSRTGTS
jgi:hypothetical protein